METFFLYIFPLSSNHDEESGTCMFLSLFLLFLSSFFFQHENSSCFELCAYGSPQCEGPGWYSEDRGQTVNFCGSKYL